jgi:hypothetical protein
MMKSLAMTPPFSLALVLWPRDGESVAAPQGRCAAELQCYRRLRNGLKEGRWSARAGAELPPHAGAKSTRKRVG